MFLWGRDVHRKERNGGVSRRITLEELAAYVTLDIGSY